MPASSSPLDLRRVDLNLLVAFDALMAERSVTAAADRLAVSQSTMSATLARLRKLLDDPVMIREGRSMVVTPVAESLIQPVRQALDEIQTMLSHRGRFDPAVDHRTFTIMTGDYAAVALIHPLLVQLHAEAPNIQLHIQAATESLAENLARNQIDMLIVPREIFPDTHHYCNEPLYRDRYVLAVDAGNPDIGPHITLDQFSTMPYLATHYGLRPSLAETQLDLLGIARRVEVTSAFGVAPFLIRDTRLITLMSEVLGRRIADVAGLRLLDPPMDLRPVTETMVWTQRVDDDPAHQWLRERLRRHARDLAPH